MTDLDMLDALVIAFVLIFAVTSLIYVIGRLLSPRSKKNANQSATYACGEKPIFQRLKLNVSLYKYLVYFIILDSSILLVAFASFSLGPLFAWPLLMVDMCIMLAAVLLLFDGGKD